MLNVILTGRIYSQILTPANCCSRFWAMLPCKVIQLLQLFWYVHRIYRDHAKLIGDLKYGISTVTYLADPRLLEDDDIPKHIERWISHSLVARYLNEPDTREYMLGGRDQEASSDNLARWEQLQTSISQWGDFYLLFDPMASDDELAERIPLVSRWLRSSLTSTHFGPTIIWRLWNQPNIVDFSSTDPVLSDYNNLILGTQHFLSDSVSLLELFRASLKVYMGVSTVLSAVWWSRFPPDAVACRSLSVVKLWAECAGIREVSSLGVQNVA